MEESIEELAKYIIKEIEKEDFYDAIKHYGGFKIQCAAKDVANWYSKRR